MNIISEENFVNICDLIFIDLSHLDYKNLNKGLNSSDLDAMTCANYICDYFSIERRGNRQLIYTYLKENNLRG